MERHTSKRLLLTNQNNSENNLDLQLLRYASETNSRNENWDDTCEITVWEARGDASEAYRKGEIRIIIRKFN